MTATARKRPAFWGCRNQRRRTSPKHSSSVRAILADPTKPTLGRFISRDPIGFSGGLNPYGYAGANPVRFTDSVGLAPECHSDDEQKKLIQKALKQILQLLPSNMSQSINGNTWTWDITIGPSSNGNPQTLITDEGGPIVHTVIPPSAQYADYLYSLAIEAYQAYSIETANPKGNIYQMNHSPSPEIQEAARIDQEFYSNYSATLLLLNSGIFIPDSVYGLNIDLVQGIKAHDSMDKIFKRYKTRICQKTKGV